jgi:Transglutaminase-like superfamily
MRVLLLLALAMLLSGCGHYGSLLYVSQTPALGWGGSVIPNIWPWPAQGTPSAQLELELSQLTSPEAISAHLQANYQWSDAHGLHGFQNPNTMTERRAGVCADFARWWVFALQRLGYHAEVVAFWTPQVGHAVALFLDRDDTWRMASNQHLYPTDLGHGERGRRSAYVRAAEEFPENGRPWDTILAYDDQGRARERLRLQSVGPELTTSAVVATRFSIQR